ncbi:capsular biosynthesis protein [Caldimonas thermodepolymerans]|jgi:capsular polysaccharide transport system permease protein|uniref:Capsular biosynthesis protein n=2 Tax=Caldimonas thermodepolymerans TaxID=215580 RepID=A0A2S5T4A0_9BURK|nr:capsular biosynthesis protein [Caldimonas thermodepolymerans]PPE69728.1 capsular biosynthesis protein [Caldimonas thermodepolymerans]QPC31861.1 capsular biosynthesis protein [Caldimonas thermodepolymerans]RDI01628.1 capsular polysaccharide transport system permease protein [Caldimonas thermodepolymerans]TCP04924.1 capsular polysaccharide transport system permease protein [Caldimonas thermodepolymerans]UZG44647.1 capsular biosynthesis protein [Caldimonas thermodepolymerans]
MMKLVSRLTAKRLQWALVYLPMLVATVYFLVFSADRYVSESVITVRQTSSNAPTGGMSGAALLLAGLTPASREDTLYLQTYIHSMGLLQKLDQQLKLREHFGTPLRDPLFRLWGGTSQEWFLEYYRSRVEVLMDDISGLLTVRVQGFEPEFAQALNRAILEESERFVNELSHRMAREQGQFAEAELERATARLQEAKRQLIAFQAKHKLLDPLAQAQATGTLTAELQAALTRQEAELRNALTYLNEDSYQVKALRSQINALRQQIDEERLRATAGKNGDRINAVAAEFHDLQLQVGFAEDAYKLALAAVESARIEATRKLKSLVVVEPPVLPEIAEYPRRWYNLATLLVVCCLIYGVVSLVVATIRDHQD